MRSSAVSRRRWFTSRASVMAIAVTLALLVTPIYADDLTATPTPQALLESTATPTATITSTPRPTSTPFTAPVAATPKPERKKHRTHHKHPTPRPAVASSPTPTPTAAKSRRKKRAHRRHAHRTPTPTPSPTPTRTPALTLTTEDSVSPVQCNGSTKHPARVPFLYPPYRGWTSLISYFDHDSPNFVHDGLVITATGLQAAPDGQHLRYDFPAYWNPSIRQYLYYDGHNGYDFDLAYQPVYAAAAGKVIFAAFEYPDMPDHGYGRMVMIQHPGGYVTLYGHFSKLLVKPGQKVRRGQRIGISGNTGHSTGPHLHFTVFHNCTPTDPYGWTGSGPDPLQSYQGESSSLLWRHSPLVLNPPPDWPGMTTLPATMIERIVLLRLPSTVRGTHAFTTALRGEVSRFRATTGLTAHDAKTNMLLGAVEVRAVVSFARLYASPDVVSISSPGGIDGQKADVLSALARAAAVTPRRSVPLGKTHSWTGYLEQWEGRTLLVGRGKKGTQVDLRLNGGHGGPKLKTLQADPKNGTYAIDLGPLSALERRQLERTLQHAGKSRSTLTVHPRRGSQVARSVRSRRSDSSNVVFEFVIGAFLLLIVGLLAAGELYYRRNVNSTPPAVK